MSYRVHVYLKSSSFSEEYANEKHQGKDSPENIRFEWEDEFRINGEFESFQVLENQLYMLQGEMSTGNAFSFEIQQTKQFVFTETTNQTVLVFSESCFDAYELDEKYKVLKVFLNDTEAIENPIPGVYLTLSDFPKELQN